MKTGKRVLTLAALSVTLSAHAQFSGTNPVYTNSNVGIGFSGTAGIRDKLTLKGNIYFYGSRSIASEQDLTIHPGTINQPGMDRAYNLYLQGGVGTAEYFTNERFSGWTVHNGGNVVINGGNVSQSDTVEYLRQFSGNVLIATNQGRVGIGTASPFDYLKLHVEGRSYFNGQISIGTESTENVALEVKGPSFFNGRIGIGNYLHSDSSIFQVKGKSFLNGKLGIGTSCIPANHIMAVKGKIMAEGVRVALANASGCWPDYVFKPGYRLMPLLEVEKYVSTHHHLPEIPSADSVQANGFSLEEMHMLQLKKMEEFTLYLIELKKENAELRKEIEALKNKR